MPTVCALLGLPIPYNCMGNLTHELVGNDILLYKRVLQQKLESINITKKIDSICLQEILSLSYKLSEKIYNEFSGINGINLVLSFSCLLVYFIAIFYKKMNVKIFTMRFIFACFIMFMISHSVYSVIHEDLLWGLLFVCNDMSFINIFVFIYCQMIGKYPQHKEDRFIMFTKLQNYFNSDLLFLKIVLAFYLLLFLLSKSKKCRYTSLKNKITNFLCHNLDANLFYLLIKYFNKSYLYDNKASFLLNDFNLDKLSMLFYEPPTLFLIHCILPKLHFKNTYQYFALSNMSLFYIGMNQSLSSINYEIPFLFGKKLNKKVGSALMLFNFLYPRFFTYKNVNMHQYLQVSTVNVVLAMIIGIWFINDHLFYFFFGGRCIFTCFYYVIDNLVYLMK
ncbi:hypothetical protein BDAP_000843 [Binucleata daphniae]